MRDVGEEKQASNAHMQQETTFIPKGIPARSPGSSPTESFLSISFACTARRYLIFFVKAR